MVEMTGARETTRRPACQPLVPEAAKQLPGELAQVDADLDDEPYLARRSTRPVILSALYADLTKED